MKQLFAAVAVVLAGCAAQPTVNERVAASSNVDLCEAQLFSAPHAAVASEVQYRGLNCQDYLQAIQMRQQQRAQAAQILLNRPQPQPYLLPMPTPQQVCTSQRIGDTVRTVCR